MNTLNPAFPASRAPSGTLRQHSLLLLMVAVHYTLALYLRARFPTKLTQAPDFLGFIGSLATGLVFAACGYAVFVMVVRRPRRLLHYLATHLRAYVTLQRVLYSLPVLFMIPMFAYSFTIVKAAIPLFHPFDWDVRLSALDAQLHGGVQPWVLLHPLLGHPLVTSILNFNYHLWFFMMFGSIYWFAFDMERPRLRLQFLFSFIVVWIVMGNVAALLMSSAGPCYFGRVTGAPDPYAPLMHYLQATNEVVPVWALNVQDLLWNSYQGKLAGVSLGISAMPSLHVASSVQLAMLGRALNRKLGIAMTVFAILIMLGSVHLGWHYAVDGYLGALGGYGVWKLVERFLRQHDGAAEGVQ